MSTADVSVRVVKDGFAPQRWKKLEKACQNVCDLCKTQRDSCRMRGFCSKKGESIFRQDVNDSHLSLDLPRKIATLSVNQIEGALQNLNGRGNSWGLGLLAS